MTQTLLDNFTNFMNARLDDAYDRLALDDGYVNETVKADSYCTKLKATINPEQAALLDSILYSKCVCLAGKRERYAYRAGLADGLRLLATLE